MDGIYLLPLPDPISLFEGIIAGIITVIILYASTIAQIF